MIFGMQITGDKELKARLESMSKEVPGETRKALRVIANRILAVSQGRVPIKTGKLKASGKVSASVTESKGALTKITYGSGGAWYAWIVHERVDIPHKTGQAKYLESAVLEARQTMGADLAREIDLRRIAG